MTIFGKRFQSGTDPFIATIWTCEHEPLHFNKTYTNLVLDIFVIVRRQLNGVFFFTLVNISYDGMDFLILYMAF